MSATQENELRVQADALLREEEGWERYKNRVNLIVGFLVYFLKTLLTKL